MKNTRLSAAFLAILLAGTVTALTGCATVSKKSGVELAEKTTESMENVNTGMKQASAQIDATNASLNELLTTGQSPAALPADVKRAFETYSNNVGKMEDTAKSLNKDIDQMNSQSNAYFQEWSKEGATYTDPEIQRLSQERRVKLSRSFTDIAATSAGMRGSLNTYLSEIKQIQNYLSNDLTPEGISAIGPIAKAAERDGNNVKSSFQPVQTAIAQARAEMTPGIGAAAGGGESSTPKRSY